MFDDHVGAVVPAVVIEDADDTEAAHDVRDAGSTVALYQPPGSITLVRTGRRGGPTGRNMYPDGWDGGHVEMPWRGSGVVRVHRRDQPWSVWKWWHGDRWQRGFYVNMETPWTRTAAGFDTRDWILDLLVEEDCDGWSWKDEDELDWCTAVGAITAAHADEVRAAGDRALAAVRAREFPFAADWDRFRPSVGWRAPSPTPAWTILEPVTEKEEP